ncbi:hypothetical protein FB451DRAFT_1237205 [Mycena latifolia]|nr:hypothetical protein FB451DRAFT_1237205 [Mycena latifolia]
MAIPLAVWMVYALIASSLILHVASPLIHHGVPWFQATLEHVRWPQLGAVKRNILGDRQGSSPFDGALSFGWARLRANHLFHDFLHFLMTTGLTFAPGLFQLALFFLVIGVVATIIAALLITSCYTGILQWFATTKRRRAVLYRVGALSFFAGLAVLMAKSTATEDGPPVSSGLAVLLIVSGGLMWIVSSAPRLAKHISDAQPAVCLAKVCQANNLRPLDVLGFLAFMFAFFFLSIDQIRLAIPAWFVGLTLLLSPILPYLTAQRLVDVMRLVKPLAQRLSANAAARQALRLTRVGGEPNHSLSSTVFLGPLAILAAFGLGSSYFVYQLGAENILGYLQRSSPFVYWCAILLDHAGNFLWGVVDLEDLYVCLRQLATRLPALFYLAYYGITFINLAFFLLLAPLAASYPPTTTTRCRRVRIKRSACLFLATALAMGTALVAANGRSLPVSPTRLVLLIGNYLQPNVHPILTSSSLVGVRLRCLPFECHMLGKTTVSVRPQLRPRALAPSRNRDIFSFVPRILGNMRLPCDRPPTPRHRTVVARLRAARCARSALLGLPASRHRARRASYTTARSLGRSDTSARGRARGQWKSQGPG